MRLQLPTDCRTEDDISTSTGFVAFSGGLRASLQPRRALMPPFVRLLPPFAVGRRTYSFFSSKPGGGRYFNSAKSPKVIAPATTTRSTQPGANVNKQQPASVDTSVTTASAEHPDRSEQIAHSANSTTTTVDTPKCETVASANVAQSPPPLRLSHPVLKPHELKLHHFFALHRPCLLLNQPTTVLFESAQTATPSPSPVATIDNPPEASAEADADAARQLSRALVINRVGNSMNWEAALQRLGVGPVDAAGSMAEGVALDSTKRKRRKKMKKHKYVFIRL